MSDHNEIDGAFRRPKNKTRPKHGMSASKRREDFSPEGKASDLSMAVRQQHAPQVKEHA